MSAVWHLASFVFALIFNIKLNVLPEKLKNNNSSIKLTEINFYCMRRRILVFCKRIKI